MSKFDKNAWYAISETRVDKTNNNLNNSLQVVENGMRVFPIADDLNWQLHPVDEAGKPGRYILRSFKAGVEKQLSACFVAEEQDSSRTRACMAPAKLNESQQWDISDWGDGTYKIQSVANGTKYWLDVHAGADVHLSSFEETKANLREAQHWVLSSRFQVNDERYSTLFTSQSQTTAKAVATSKGSTGTTPAGNAATPTSTGGTAAGANEGSNSGGNSQTASGGLSTGASVGIGVGVMLAVLAALGTLLFFWRKRRRDNRSSVNLEEKRSFNLVNTTQPPSSGYHDDQAGHSQAGAANRQHDENFSSPTTSGGGYYYQDQSKSPMSNMVSPEAYKTTLHEAPTQEVPSVFEAVGSTVAVEIDGTERHPGMGTDAMQSGRPR